MTSHTPLRIDFVSDIACPWCAIGLASLRQALTRLDGTVDVEIHLQPFEVNPQLPPEGEDANDRQMHKYGISEEQHDLDLSRFRSGLLRAMLSSKETGYDINAQR